MPKLTTGSHTGRSLVAIADRLHGLSERVRLLSVSVAAHGLEPIVLYRQADLLDGLRVLEGWVGAANQAVSDRLASAGLFGEDAGAEDGGEEGGTAASGG